MKLIDTFSKSLFTIVVGCSLFACGGDKPADTTSTQSESTPQVQTKSANTVVVAISPDFAPYSYLNETGQAIGFDIDLMNAIGAAKGLTIEYKPSNFDNIFKEIDNKTADVAISAIFHSEERANKYGLSQPYTYDQLVYFYRTDNAKLANTNPNSLADLNNKNLDISATEGTLHLPYIDAAINSHSSVTPLRTDFLSFTGVIQQKYDVGFTDGSILDYFIANNLKDNSIELKKVAYQDEKRGYVIMLNKDNTALLEKINESIDELTKNGEIGKLKQKYGLQ